MSFPGSGLETTYRNDLKDVAKMLKTKHQQNFMVGYRVCYHGDVSLFDVVRFSTCQREATTSQSSTIRYPCSVKCRVVSTNLSSY